MHQLTNKQLIETYQAAIRLELDQQFISLLTVEITERNIKVENKIN